MRVAAFLAIAVAFLTLSAQGQVSTPIGAVPFTIKKPGNYVLKKNLRLTKTATAAINIASDDVVLDLGGRVLSSGLPTGTSVVGIQDAGGYGNIVVKNGTVRGFEQGVRLNSYQANVTGVTVEDIKVDRSSGAGISVLGEQMIVRRCTVTNTGGSPGGTFGIYVDGGTAIVKDNEVLNTVGPEGVAADGIKVGCQSAVIEGNRVLNPPGTLGSRGISLGLATYYLAENNRITGFTTGIYFTNAVGEYRNNFTVGCTTPYSGGVDSGNNK